MLLKLLFEQYVYINNEFRHVDDGGKNVQANTLRVNANNEVFLQGLLKQPLHPTKALESISSLEKKCKERKLMFGALLLFCFTATVQLFTFSSYTLATYTALGLFGAALPFLCTIFLFEQWQVLHNRYDYLQHKSKYGFLMLHTELLTGALVVVGIGCLFFNVHPLLCIPFGASVVGAAILFGNWRTSVAGELN